MAVTNANDDTVKFETDALGRKTAAIDPLGFRSEFQYDENGNLNAAANGSVGYGFTYDRRNRLTQKTDGRGRNLSFSFDKVGNILTKTTYQGSTTSYTYNAANRLTMLRNPDYTQVDYQYDPAGRLLSKVTANGARLTQQFDANGWQTRLTQYDAANALISDIRTWQVILTTSSLSITTLPSMEEIFRIRLAGRSLIERWAVSYRAFEIPMATVSKALC